MGVTEGEGRMMSTQMNSLMKRFAAIGGVGALLVTYGCGATQTAAGLRAQDVPAAPAGAPIVVGCEANQRTLVRPSVVNGVAVSQVDCVSTGEAAAYAQNFAAAPVAAPVTAVGNVPSYRASAPRVMQPAPQADLPDARVIPASYPAATAARPVRTQEIVYDDRPVRAVKPARSVKKSAIIVGSSAGAGAGLGAVVGGKKGALIGAVVGGGGAALWDQVTRRKQ
jgi:hypothetical protein